MLYKLHISYSSSLMMTLNFTFLSIVHTLLFIFSLLSSILRLQSDSWFISNRLSVNPSKADYLLIGNSLQRAKVNSATVSFCGNTLTPTTSCRNLGVVFDCDLSFQKHISNICSSSFYHIRQLRQIRSLS